MTNSEYQAAAETTAKTAARDLDELVERASRAAKAQDAEPGTSGQ